MNDTSMKPILCVVTSHPIRGDSGEPTGFAMVELTHPLQVFEAAGIFAHRNWEKLCGVTAFA